MSEKILVKKSKTPINKFARLTPRGDALLTAICAETRRNKNIEIEIALAHYAKKLGVKVPDAE